MLSWRLSLDLDLKRYIEIDGKFSLMKMAMRNAMYVIH
jgi:hypothetical protein